MKKEDIKWIPHIPLIGGFPLGAERAVGHAPEFIASLPGFLGNDSHYIAYQNETHKRDLDYRPIDPDDRKFREKINIVVSTPPCAALSQLNTSKSEDAKGAGCAKNDFMYITAEQAIMCFHADVVLIENAPALYTKKGQGVADKLQEIAKKHNYGMTLYKTSTIYHGVPQNRDRTFAILWRGGEAPIMDWIREDYVPLGDYLKLVPADSTQRDMIINEKIIEDGCFMFIQARTEGKAREAMIDAKKITAWNWILKEGLIDEALEWAEETGNEKCLKFVSHAKKKFAMGLGIWDSSAHVFNQSMNAVIGRNMNDTVHPTEDRSLNVREALHMMSFPHDFELQGGRKNINHIAQNVPACTAESMVQQACLFIQGKLPMSGTDFVRQNNHTRKNESPVQKTTQLTNFMT